MDICVSRCLHHFRHRQLSQCWSMRWIDRHMVRDAAVQSIRPQHGLISIGSCLDGLQCRSLCAEQVIHLPLLWSVSFLLLVLRHVVGRSLLDNPMHALLPQNDSGASLLGDDCLRIRDPSTILGVSDSIRLVGVLGGHRCSPHGDSCNLFFCSRSPKLTLGRIGEWYRSDVCRTFDPIPNA